MQGQGRGKSLLVSEEAYLMCIDVLLDAGDGQLETQKLLRN